MRIWKFPAVFFTMCAANLLAADFAGHWKVVYAGPVGSAPKTVGSIVLDLKDEGSAVTGTVVIGPWPGEAPVAESKMEGDHLIFTATGHLGSTTGIPTCRIDASLEGDEMVVSMTVIRNDGGPLSASQVYLYRGKRKMP